MKTKRLLPFLSILICFTVLAGCVNQIGIPKRLSSGIMNAGYPVIGIESNGKKHIAWVEERFTGIGQHTHAIIYLRTTFGETGTQYQFTPPTNFIYSEPDISVTENGSVYLVWMKYHETDPGEVYGCYDIIPPSDPFTPTCHQLSDYASESYKIVDPPKVSANGNEVYAIYNVPYELDFQGMRLRYRQLGSILDDYTGWVSQPSLFQDHAYQLAVDSNGKAHVTWLQYDGIHNAVMYNSNITVDGFGSMNGQRLLSTSGSYNNITITGNPTEEVFVTYKSISTSSIHIAHCATSSCVSPISTFIVPLDPAIEPWSTWYLNPGAANNTLYLTFRGKNDLTTGSDYEIFFYTYPSSSSPTRITNNDYEDYDPMIASSDGIPVVGWVSHPGAYYVRYIWDSFNGIRKVSDSFVAYNEDGDLASNGEWVAGAWTDFYSEEDTTNTIWLAFNAYMVDLPLIVK